NRVRDRTDAAAWAEFVRVYQPVIRAFVRRHGVTAGDVPDLVQDIFARLVPTLARFQFDPARGQFRTWLWRIASNAAANWNRKRASRVRAEATWRARRSDPLADSAAEADTPDDRDQHDRYLLNRVLVEVRGTTLPATWACFEGRVLHDRPAGELA